MKLDKIFYWIGLKVSIHPLKVIAVSVLVLAIILSGLMFLEFEVKYEH